MAEGEQEDQSQKTEEPTAKKLEEARKKGQVPLSREINNWMMLLIGTILIAALAGPMLSEITRVLSFFIGQSHEIPYGVGGVKFALSESFIHILKAMSLPLILLFFVAFLGPFAQVGPLFSAETLKPDFSKVSVIKGFGRLFSLRSLTEFAKGILKIALVGVVGAIILAPYFSEVEHIINLPVLAFLKEMQAIIVKMMLGILVVMAVIAFADLMYQRYDHSQKMRMTKQELKDEYKQTEGDPHVKSRLRQLRSERARQRMMQAVPDADVVITNPTHYSIALKYNPEEMEAPVCVAKGVDELALRIRETAKEHDVIIYENKPLARTLYDVVDVEETIPVEHFRAVAEVISYVFKKKGRL